MTFYGVTDSIWNYEFHGQGSNPCRKTKHGVIGVVVNITDCGSVVTGAIPV